MLIERDASLAALTGLVGSTQAGQGHIALLGGEAGVGKTALVAAVTAWAATTGAITVRRGGCDDITTAAALGPLLEAVPELAELVDSDSDKLRMLTRLHDLFVDEPTLLVVEDLHWADGATLDALRYLGRRITDTSLLLLATYRIDGLAGRRHPVTRLLGELARSPATVRIELAPLSRAGVGALVEQAGSRIDPGTLHTETSGNPFFVTEVLATPRADVPVNVRDAVLTRTEPLTAGARDALAAAAVLGGRNSLELLTTVAGCADADVDECVANGVLVADADGCAFRHELARRAIGSTLGPGRLADLHRAAYAALAASPGAVDDRRLAHHAAGCGNEAAVLLHAVRAGDTAARLGAHREAADQYRAALRRGGAADTARIGLLQALSYECYLTEQLDEAMAARLKVLDLAMARDDPALVGATLRWLSRLAWYLGRNAESDRYARRAHDTLAALGDSPELAMAISNLAQLHMLEGRHEAAIESGRRALAMARRVDDRDTEIHALNNIGASTALSGDVVAGEQLLTRSLDLALATDAHEHAARAYTNLGSTTALTRELARAERHLRAGIAYCALRDLDSWRFYMTAVLAHTQLDGGNLTAAEDSTATVLAHPELSPITRIGAVAVASLVALRRGSTDASGDLDSALAMATDTGEAQRLVPVVAARAEAAWLAGRIDDIPVEIDRAWPSAVREGQPWYVGELATWLVVAGRRPGCDLSGAEPFALMVAGRWADAAEAWLARDCRLWAALSLARLPTLAHARHALALVHETGAVAWAPALLRDRAAAGLPVPRPPRAATRDAPRHLTAREMEVLALLADGLSNAEVGHRLFLSQKTVGHHVSAVLRKLGEPTRARAVATARREGIVATATDPPT